MTLTYSPANMPSDGGLHVEDFQKFAKRLRKRVGRFRYFHCGEYGDEGGRPHYHALLFGLDFRHDQVELDRGPGKAGLFCSPTLDAAWQLGHASIGELTPSSAAYVARYAVKDAGKDYVDFNTGELIRRPYVSMSRRPGIGDAWFKRFHKDVYPLDYVVLEGRKYRPPRYYDDKLDDQVLDELKADRARRARERKEDLTPERLRTRERVAQLRAAARQRDLA